MSAPGWESCLFHQDGSQYGDCELTADQTQRPCPQDSYLHVTPDGLCQLVINNIQVCHQIFSSVKYFQIFCRMFITEDGGARWNLT